MHLNPQGRQRAPDGNSSPWQPVTMKMRVVQVYSVIARALCGVVYNSFAFQKQKFLALVSEKRFCDVLSRRPINLWQAEKGAGNLAGTRS